MHPADVAEFAERGWHCETRRCRMPAAIVTQRSYRHHGRDRDIEHFACETHGTAFAQRHRIEIDPASEREARRLSEPEMAALAAGGRHCDGPACRNPATCIFLERYMRQGQREVLERLACDRHVAMFSQRLHVEPGPSPEEDR